MKGPAPRTIDQIRAVLHERSERIPESGCWIWLGATNGTGYGVIGYRGRQILTHRLSLIANGTSVPDELCVLHRCDVRSCINPNHLFIGTNQDNVDDAVKKGRNYRHPIGKYAGELVNTAKVDKSTVLDIRRRASNGETKSSIAEDVGIAISSVCRIVNRRTWKHI